MKKLLNIIVASALLGSVQAGQYINESSCASGPTVTLTHTSGVYTWQALYNSYECGMTGYTQPGDPTIEILHLSATNGSLGYNVAWQRDKSAMNNLGQFAASDCDLEVIDPFYNGLNPPYRHWFWVRSSQSNLNWQQDVIDHYHNPATNETDTQFVCTWDFPAHDLLFVHSVYTWKSPNLSNSSTPGTEPLWFYGWRIQLEHNYYWQNVQWAIIDGEGGLYWTLHK